MGLDDMRLAVQPGAGLVVRFHDAALVLPESTGDDPVVADLILCCRAGDHVADKLRELAQRPGAPPFCALIDEGDVLGLYVHGAMRVAAELPGNRLSHMTTDPARWFQETLPDKLLTMRAAAKAASGAADPGDQGLLDLVEGIVPGAGMELTPRGPALGAAAYRASTRKLARDKVRAAAVESGAPLEEVTHEVPVVVAEPAAEVTPAAAAAEVPAEAPTTFSRVVIGKLSGEGVAVLVDGNMLIGRQPQASPEVTDGTFSPVAVPAGVSAVSRIHAEIRIEGDDAMLCDRGSANGTFVMGPRGGDWVRLEADRPVRIVHGSRFRLGPLELTYEPPD